MEHIPLPTAMQLTAQDSAQAGRLTIEPFFPGYGTTVGNALRRVMLSSLSGGALTAFSVKGAQHEFSALPHVKEDFVEIAINLKQVRLKIVGPEPVRLHLAVKGERKVVAGDITAPSNVEIVNRDLLLATLTDPQATLEMDFLAQAGRGYAPTESREKEELEVGMIALDALYSPIRKVGFQVENVRVGQMTNWDKLVLDIETDGTMTPREALQQACQYLLEHFTAIANYTEEGQTLENATTAGIPVAEAAEIPQAAATTALTPEAAGPPAPAKPAKRKSKKSVT